MSFAIVRVTDQNLVCYLNLAQAYEGEFSVLTRKSPDEKGLFALDTELGGSVAGFLLLVDGIPAGLAAVALNVSETFEVCEFYVVPSFRNKGMGVRFAHALWRMFPGRWEVKQIAGADYATAFWRKAISEWAPDGYTEDRYDDPYWGMVTRQRFSSQGQTAPTTASSVSTDE